jgi:hypothetical protein
MTANSLELIDAENDLCLEIGTELILSIEGVHRPVKSAFVGQKGCQYIVIAFPENLSDIENGLHAGKNIKIKYLFEKEMLSFTTKLKEIVSTPLRFLLLDYPASIVRDDARSHKRISCFISAQVEINNKIRGGVIKNISKSGCLIIFKLSNRVESQLKTGDPIALNLYFPGIDGQQEIIGMVKEIQTQNKQLKVGIEFSDTAWWVPPYN